MGRLRAHVRPHVRSHVRSPLQGRYGSAGFHDGISFNAGSGQVVVRAPGAAPTIGTLTSAFTFTGGNQSMFLGSGGLLLQSATNTPRIEYDSGGSVLGLLMEASRTNLCLQSADLATSWTVSGSTASTNATAAPDGTTTADKLVESAGGTFHLVRQDITITANTAYTFSLFVKASGRTACKLQVSNTLENTGANADFDLTAVTAGAPVNFGTGSSSEAKIQAYPNGWYRISLRTTIDAASVTGRVQLLLANPVGTTSYSGDGASGMFLWGMQYEQGNFMSSHIPTTTVSVARTADVCTRTLGSEFSATAGSVIVAGRASGGQDAAASQFVWSFDNGTTAERIMMGRPLATDTASHRVSTASVFQAVLDATFTNLTGFKSGFAWALNDFAASFNGAAVLTDAVGTLPTVTQCVIGGQAGAAQGNCWIKSFDYYPSRLSNDLLVLRSA